MSCHAAATHRAVDQHHLTQDRVEQRSLARCHAPYHADQRILLDFELDRLEHWWRLVLLPLLLPTYSPHEQSQTHVNSNDARFGKWLAAQEAEKDEEEEEEEEEEEGVGTGSLGCQCGLALADLLQRVARSKLRAFHVLRRPQNRVRWLVPSECRPLELDQNRPRLLLFL